MTEPELRYEFGKNWQDFLSSNLSRERIDIAKRKILSFTGLQSLEGMRIADLGCGSGIHSLAMFEAGAKELVSIDYDRDSVAASQELWRSAGSPSTWDIRQGSVLDTAFMRSLGQFDMVYCWGVLHHTGDVWSAIDNVVGAVAPDGLFQFALYDSDVYPETPEFWLELKRNYTASGQLRRRLYEAWYVLAKILRGNPLRLPHLLSLARHYKENRGMALYTDIKDWLGGWPMEFTRIYEVLPHLQKHSMQLLRVQVGEGNTDYLFAGPTLRAGLSYPPIPLPNPLEWSVQSLRHEADFAALTPKRAIYVYGTGRGGDVVHDALVKVLGTPPAGFITTDTSGRHRGLPVQTLSAFMATAPEEAQIIVASKHFDAISIALAQHGIRRFWNAYPYAIQA